MLLVAGVCLFFPWNQGFLAILLLLILFHLFQSSITPVADSIALDFCATTKVEYGNIRLWGAIGFAISVYITGQVSQWTNHSAIFYIAAISFVMALLFIVPVPVPANRAHVDLLSGLRKLVTLPHFLLFLLCSFLIFGTMNANNFYFGIYYQNIGGTLAGIGLVFLLAAGSEAPLMRIGGKIIARLGLENTLILASCMSLIRWILFFIIRDPMIIMGLFFLQGLSIGLYLTAAPQYVKLHTPSELRVTALTLYVAFGHGVGTMVCNFVGGMLYDRYSIFGTYIFFALFTAIGVGALILLKRFAPRTEHIVKQV
jgi:PPP family 3-phenylpropionic acid transporter